MTFNVMVFNRFWKTEVLECFAEICTCKIVSVHLLYQLHLLLGLVVSLLAWLFECPSGHLPRIELSAAIGPAA